MNSKNNGGANKNSQIDRGGLFEENYSLDGLRVFLVEDEPDTRELFTFIFESVGADVKIATTLNEARKILKNYEPDIIVSNISLPDGDGCDLIREVRAREAERGENPPAIAVTAAAFNKDRLRVLECGFQMHVAKPIEPAKLIKAVASLTEREEEA